VRGDYPAAQGATRAELNRPHFLVLLAEAYGKAGQAEEGLTVIAEGLATAHKTGERYYEAELYRLKGTLLLNAERGMMNDEFKKTRSPIPIQRSAFSIHRSVEAEACFQKAIEIALRQQAKSLELRAAMSLARLWQWQGKKKEAHSILSEIYDWFTEGFDIVDLKEAKALLAELS
jgi:predicted ATPase